MKNILAAAALAALSLTAAPAFAAPFSDADRTAIADKVAEFDQNFQDGDIGAVITSVAPRVFAIMADDMGMSVEDLSAMVDAQVEAMMAQVTVLDYSMDLDAAQYLEAPSGTPYALIPTRTRMQVGEQIMQGVTQSFVFIDDGEVFLARIDEAMQLELLIRAYPEFAGIEVIEGTMEIVE